VIIILHFLLWHESFRDLELPMWMFQYIVAKAMKIPPAEWLHLKYSKY